MSIRSSTPTDALSRTEEDGRFEGDSRGPELARALEGASQNVPTNAIREYASRFRNRPRVPVAGRKYGSRRVLSAPAANDTAKQRPKFRSGRVVVPSVRKPIDSR